MRVSSRSPPLLSSATVLLIWSLESLQDMPRAGSKGRRREPPSRCDAAVARASAGHPGRVAAASRHPSGLCQALWSASEGATPRPGFGLYFCGSNERPLLFLPGLWKCCVRSVVMVGNPRRLPRSLLGQHQLTLTSPLPARLPTALPGRAFLHRRQASQEKLKKVSR